MPRRNDGTTYRKQMEVIDYQKFTCRKPTFHRFRKNNSGNQQKVLTDNLRALEDDGLIDREVFAEVPPRVEYSLTPLGETLRPILDAMFDWGANYKSGL